MTLNANPLLFPEPVEQLDADQRPEALLGGGHRPPYAALRRAGGSGWIAPLALAAGDAAVYLATIWAVAGFRPGDAAAERLLLLVAGAALLAFASARLYPGYRLHPHERLRRRMVATLKIAFGAGLLAWLLLGSADYALLVGLLLAAGAILQPLVSAGIALLLHKRGFWGENAVLFGAPAELALASAALRRNWRYGLIPRSGGRIGRARRSC